MPLVFVLRVLNRVECADFKYPPLSNLKAPSTGPIAQPVTVAGPVAPINEPEVPPVCIAP